MSTPMPVTGKISLESTLKVVFNQLLSKFGDGYEQVAPNGLNNVIDTWDIIWGGLTTSEYQTVMTALRSVGTWGVLLYTPCDEPLAKKFRVAGDVTATREGTTYKVTTQLRQVFDI
jgi:phage-related protein